MWHLTVEDVGLWIWHLNFFLYVLLLFGMGILGGIIQELSKA